jgi:hypothetical protein
VTELSSDISVKTHRLSLINRTDSSRWRSTQFVWEDAGKTRSKFSYELERDAARD